MILLHRLRGEPMYLNADLIESVEATPDTVVRLTDGRRLIVAESPERVAELTRTFHASVLLETCLQDQPTPRLTLLAQRGDTR